LTGSWKKGDNKRKGAPQKAQPDQRIVEFVRLLARQAAEQDFARELELHAKARNHGTKRREP
jgi:hypothetical protein